ncbi:endo-polygalacturonase-like [Bacillus rossius redtenbacheri]|uniref:endo-polygalacturonase-like n=1 Tax=Bacillus rossius redtenbacheri TaxID=93214 RepID=UPI002FDEE378
MQKPNQFGIFAIFTILALVHIGHAQDLRKVSEPKTPQTCISLKASGKDDTEIIQKALNSCTKGKAVELASGTFNSGHLTIPSGVSLVVDSGVTLKAIPNPKLYGTGSCGTVSTHGSCNPFIAIYGAKGSGIYGKGTIDGQGNQKLTGTSTTWWDLSHIALVEGKNQNNPRLINIRDSEDITIHQITLKNSPLFNIATSNTNGFTAWGVTIEAPASARNTDAIDPTGSQNVTIAHCNISVGDDNVAISSLHGPSRHISILNNHFGSGNGMSIGSGTLYGISDVLVSGLTFVGSLNGVHIKSSSLNGGLVTRITYNNLCVSGVMKPIDLDMRYMNYTGSHVPHYSDITFNHMKVVTKGRFKFHGISSSNEVSATLNDVHITKGSIWDKSYASIKGSAKEDATGHCGWAGYM